MALKILHKRSSEVSKRPLDTLIEFGELTVNFADSEPGVYHKTQSGNIIKVGSAHVGTTAPNAVPAAGGSSGNSTGEFWYDTSTVPGTLNIWDGSAWVSATDGNFVPRTSATGSAVLPTGTTAERDVSPLEGYTRYNTDLGLPEIYNGVSWNSLPYLISEDQTFNITNLTEFEEVVDVLNKSVAAEEVVITINLAAGTYVLSDTLRLSGQAWRQVRIVGDSLTGAFPRGLSDAGVGGGIGTNDGFAYTRRPSSATITATFAINDPFIRARYSTIIESGSFTALSIETGLLEISNLYITIPSPAERPEGAFGLLISGNSSVGLIDFLCITNFDAGISSVDGGAISEIRNLSVVQNGRGLEFIRNSSGLQNENQGVLTCVGNDGPGIFCTTSSSFTLDNETGLQPVNEFTELSANRQGGLIADAGCSLFYNGFRRLSIIENREFGMRISAASSLSDGEIVGFLELQENDFGIVLNASGSIEMGGTRLRIINNTDNGIIGRTGSSLSLNMANGGITPGNSSVSNNGGNQIRMTSGAVVTLFDVGQTMAIIGGGTNIVAITNGTFDGNGAISSAPTTSTSNGGVIVL